MDSYRSYWNSSIQSKTWVEGEDQDVYEVESRVPLPRPFPLCSTLNEKNAVVVQTQISHVNHRTNGHLLKVISKISLPTPPYTVSLNVVTLTHTLWLCYFKQPVCSMLRTAPFNILEQCSSGLHMQMWCVKCRSTLEHSISAAVETAGDYMTYDCVAGSRYHFLVSRMLQ